MVRVGEYSPNFRGNNSGIEGVNRGIFGFGEYEEKRKYYNEQRKLEYKQYIAQQALKVTPSRDSKNKSHTPTTDKGVFSNGTLTDIISTSGRREVSTQTVNGEQRDASTNTDVAIPRESQKYVPSNDHLINHSATNPYQTDTWKVKKRDTTDIETPHNLSNDGLPGYLKQDTVNGLTIGLKEKDHLYLNAATAAYERELRAQIEEKRSHTRELERREQQEAELRERWLAEEARRELERHEAEEKRIKALENLRRQRIEDFCNRSEQLQREAKEIRRMKMRDQREVTDNLIIGAESNRNGKSYTSEELASQKTSKSIPKVSTIQSQKSDKLKLTREQCDDHERHLEQNSIGPERLKMASADGVTSKSCLTFCHLREDECPNSTTEKNYSSSNILSHLGDIRRQLATQQMKMEETIKKNKTPVKEV